MIKKLLNTSIIALAVVAGSLIFQEDYSPTPDSIFVMRALLAVFILRLIVGALSPQHTPDGTKAPAVWIPFGLPILKVIDGDGGFAYPLYFNPRNSTLYFRHMVRHKFRRGEWKATVISETDYKSMGKTLLGGAAGGLLFGGAGAIVGGMASGNKNKETTIALEYGNFRSLVKVKNDLANKLLFNSI